ncbi:NTP transferase domain-containing protein [Lewinella sp. IMCC34183]|uniref:NTP transferase domain-containing protein n=1 Tax=Lewinella sp. IMCC34183 TaxID=2248762 RepID=UPI000E2402DB|nr:NTP transferase domain-containing protein [Lewinella sp. IMCC34183]
MHEKHPPLKRPDLGQYGRTEFALVGTTCARIEQLMNEWLRDFSSSYRSLGITGEHAEPEVPVTLRRDRKLAWTDHENWSPADDRLQGSAYDLVLVNGNHYPARRQIVFVDDAKAGTLQRRADELTDIFAVVHVSGEPALPDWLRTVIRRQSVPPLMTTLSMLHLLRDGIEQELRANVPRLNALILAGGESQRMGEDKGRLVYRDGKTEVERLAELCTRLHLPVSVSVRQEKNRGELSYPLIPDRFLGLGPAGAICSAFLARPDTAWLVLACDLPLLTGDTLRKLIDARRPDRTATAVRGPGKEWPEPLVAIYEPRAYRRLLDFLSLGYACPRKVLINSDTEIVQLDDERPITNANTPEERDRVRSELKR